MGRVYKPKGAAAWFIDYVDADGKRVRKRASKDKRVAVQILRDAEHKRDRIRAGLESAVSNDVDVWGLHRDYRAHLEANGRRPETLRRTQSRIVPLLEHIGAQKVSDITLDRLDAYKSEARNRRTGEPLAPQTINDSIQAVRRMLNWAVRHIRIAENPLQYVELVERRKVHARRPLEEWEITRLLEKSPPHYRQIWTAFLTTGLRHKELVELRWRDVELDGTRKLLRVAEENCKVKREDFLPIGPELEAVLREIIPETPDPDAHVFVNAAGRPWRNNLLKRFKSCVKAAGKVTEEEEERGVRGIDPTGLDIHSLRQTFGTRLAAAGVDVKTVQTLMRHKTIAMTMQLYVKPRALNLREAVQNLTLPESDKEQAKGDREAAQAVAG